MKGKLFKRENVYVVKKRILHNLILKNVNLEKRTLATRLYLNRIKVNSNMGYYLTIISISVTFLAVLITCIVLIRSVLYAPCISLARRYLLLYILI